MADIAPHARFEIVPANTLPPGRLIDVTEKPGEVTVRLCQGHIRTIMVRQLQTWHDMIFEDQRWLQRWNPPAQPDGFNDDAPVPVGRYEFVPAGTLPEGYVCYPVEAGREFIWQVIEGNMSEDLRTQYNDWLKGVLTAHHFVRGTSIA